MNTKPGTERVQLALQLGSLLLAVGTLGCAKDVASASGPRLDTEYETLTLRYQGSAGAVSYPELAEDLGLLAPLKLQHVGNTISGPQDIQAAVTGDVDFGGAFNGAILKLAASKAPIKAVVGLAGIDAESWSGFYVLEGSPIRSARDLLGKKIAMNTLGAHHEFVLREYLARAGLTRAEVEQVSLIPLPPLNTEQALRARQVDVAVLGNLHRDKALERGGIRKLFSDYELFGPITSAAYVVSERFAQRNPRTVGKFVAAVGGAIEWARNTSRQEVIARMRQIIRARGRAEDDSVVGYFRPVKAETQGGVLTDAQFQRWIDWLVRDGQLTNGQLRARDVYTNRFNPYATPSGPH
jgi:ABC-type nitrate/sulfonate/bicarbonate transport system substrate-binding protein